MLHRNAAKEFPMFSFARLFGGKSRPISFGRAARTQRRTCRPGVEVLEDRFLMSAGLRGDYTGDHRTDMVVYRPTDGTWYIRQSDGDFMSTWSRRWGLP